MDGKLNGKYYTEYVEQVKELKRNQSYDAAIQLLQDLIGVIENESKHTGFGVPPWYYDQLSIIYKKNNQHEKAKQIIERFANQKHGPGKSTEKLLAKLEKKT